MIHQLTIDPSCTLPHDSAESDALARDPMIGRCLANRYIVREVIGEGAMGKVFVAEQLSVGRDVAIKVMKRELFQDPGLAGRFNLEMEIISSLQHPNIVRLLDTGHDEGLDAHFIVMEYVEGISLGDLLYDREVDGALLPELAIEIAIQLCSALTEPHQLGVIHRDIKPDNIILTVQSDEQLAIKLLDFGVARVVDPHEKIDSAAARARLTATGGIVGTPPYIAPELCEGSSRASHQSDLYAIGAMLFELLTGHQPFRGRSTAELLFMHVHEPAPRLRECADFTHCAAEALEELILDLLEKAPEDRPSSALEVMRRLEEILEVNALEVPAVHLPASRSTYQALSPFIVATHAPRALQAAEDIALKKTLESDPATKTLAGNPVFVMTPRQTLSPELSASHTGAPTHESESTAAPEELSEKAPAIMQDEVASEQRVASALPPTPEAVLPLRTRNNAQQHTGIFTPASTSDALLQERGTRLPTSIAASFGLGALLLTLLLTYTTQDSTAQPLEALPLSTQSLAASVAPQGRDHIQSLGHLAPSRRAKPSITQASHALHGALSSTASNMTRPSSHAEQTASALHDRARALSLDLATSRPSPSSSSKTRKPAPSRKSPEETSMTRPDHNQASAQVIATSDRGQAAQPKRLKRIKKKIDWLYKR